MNIFKKFPSLSILLAGGLWGLTGLFVRTLNDTGLDNMQLLFFRSTVTAATIIIYLFIKDKNKLKIDFKDWWYFFGTGILSFLLFGFCYFYTISHASMSVAAILLYTAPFFVMIMASIFFKEKITAAKVIALFMAAAGCILICGTDHNITLSPFVIFTGISSGVCYALYSIFGRVALKKYDSLTVTAYTFIFASIGSIFIADFPKIVSVMSQNPEAILITLTFTIVSAVLPYVFYTNGLKYIDAGKASIMATFEAVVASVTGIIAFGESITIAGISGIFLVLFAVAMLNKKK